MSWLLLGFREQLGTKLFLSHDTWRLRLQMNKVPPSDFRAEAFLGRLAFFAPQVRGVPFSRGHWLAICCVYITSPLARTLLLRMGVLRYNSCALARVTIGGNDCAIVAPCRCLLVSMHACAACSCVSRDYRCFVVVRDVGFAYIVHMTKRLDRFHEPALLFHCFCLVRFCDAVLLISWLSIQ